MNVILFGATGMVGQGVLRECLLEADVQKILSIGRTASGQQHPKLRELVRPDLLNFSAIDAELAGFDACFFCLGISSAGMTEESYRRVTYDITLAVAETLARLNPDMTFIYVSGQGADSTGKGRVMWARVKGDTGECATWAFQVCLYLPSGSDSAPSRDPFEDYRLPPGLRRHGSADAAA